MGVVELRQARQVAVGDTLVSAGGRSYEVVKLARIGRGMRVDYVDHDGRRGRFTAAPDSILRVRVAAVA